MPSLFRDYWVKIKYIFLRTVFQDVPCNEMLCLAFLFTHSLRDSLSPFVYKDQPTDRLFRLVGIVCGLFFKYFGIDYSFALAPDLFLPVV